MAYHKQALIKYLIPAFDVVSGTSVGKPGAFLQGCCAEGQVRVVSP